MKNALVQFVVITGMLLKLFSVTIFAENALNSTLPTNGGLILQEDSVITAGNNGPQAALFATPTKLIVDPASGLYNGPITLKATLSKLLSLKTVPISGKTVTFKLNGTTVGTATTNDDGVASLNIQLPADIDVGLYLLGVRAEFAGDASYLGSFLVAPLTVDPAPTELSVDNVTAPYGSTVTISARLVSSITGRGLKNKDITILINNVLKGIPKTDAKGVATLDVDLGNMEPGSYPILAAFLPFDKNSLIGNYDMDTVTAILKIKGLQTSLSVSASEGIYGGNTSLQATLSSSGIPLADKKVKFTFNGSSYSAKTDENGVAAVDGVSISGIDAGFYKGIIKAKYAASEMYDGCSSQGDLTVSPAQTMLAVSNASGTYHGTTSLTARLTTGDSPLSGMNISFNFNGASFTGSTDENGIVTVNNVSLSDINAGTYNGFISATFAGSLNYQAASGIGNLTVQQAPVSIIVDNQQGYFGGSVTLTAVLTTLSIPLPDMTIDFSLNGVFKGHAQTDANGKAVLENVSLAGLDMGTYVIEASFTPPSPNYATGLGKGSLEVLPIVTCVTINKITAAYCSKVDLEATLTCNGAPLCGRPVEFRIKDQFVGAAITNAEGKAVKNCIELTGLSAGLHPGAFCATFVAADHYLGCSSTADIEISKACTGVWVESAEGQYSDLVTLTALVSSEALECLNKSGGRVEFKYQLNNGPQHTLGSACQTGIRDGKLLFNFKFICSLDPDDYKIFAEFTPTDRVNFNTSCSNAPYAHLMVEPENTLVEYNGPQYFSAPSCSNASLTFSVAIIDTNDGYRGDISNARVEFREAALGSMYNNWIVQATNLPVFLTDPADITKGISTSQPFSRNLTQSELNTSGVTFDVYTKVRGNYTKLSNPSLVTIATTSNDNVSGGGFIVPTSSSGKYRGKPGARTDFGFTMKYDKSCETVPGLASIIIRGENGKIYQVNSTTISSLSVFPAENNLGKAASFSALANLIDITDPFNQVTLGRNLCLTIEMYDDGKDKAMDAISITLRGEKSELLFSNDWDGSRTLPQRLDMSIGDGKIAVLGSSVLSGVEAENFIPVEYALFQNYPNPFNPSTTIQYDLPEDSRVKIAVYDILGKEIASVVNEEIPAGRHQAVWNSQNSGGSFASGMYILLIRAESLNSQRSLITAKKMMLVK